MLVTVLRGNHTILISCLQKLNLIINCISTRKYHTKGASLSLTLLFQSTGPKWHMSQVVLLEVISKIWIVWKCQVHQDMIILIKRKKHTPLSHSRYCLNKGRNHKHTGMWVLRKLCPVFLTSERNEKGWICHSMCKSEHQSLTTRFKGLKHCLPLKGNAWASQVRLLRGNRSCLYLAKKDRLIKSLQCIRWDRRVRESKLIFIITFNNPGTSYDTSSTLIKGSHSKKMLILA